MQFEGKTVVVTGASSGIGREIAREFAEEGATVIAVARRVERLEALEKESEAMSGKIIAYPGDVRKQETNEGMIDRAIELTGKIDILVNNAGVMDGFEPIGEVAVEDWNMVLETNLFGPMYALRKAVPIMLDQDGLSNIVNVASIGGLEGCRAGACYAASKHGLVGLTKNTAFMYAHTGKIRCNVIAPGGVDTECNDLDKQPPFSKFGCDRVMAGLDPNLGMAQPEDIARMVLFVCGDGGKFFQGSVVRIDGGCTCN